MPEQSISTIQIDGNTLTLEQLEQVARYAAPVELAVDALQKMEHSRRVIDRIVAGDELVYSVNTGFGGAQPDCDSAGGTWTRCS